MGMCGPIVIIANQSAASHFFYHIGRLLDYLLLGVFAGTFGQYIFLHVSHSLVAYITPLSMGSVFVFLGSSILFEKNLHLSLQNIVQKPLQKHIKEPSLFSPLFVGFLSIGLPCGWLYGFVLGAATTNNAFVSVLFMLMFWLSTVPLLLIGPSLTQKFIAPFKKRFPRLAGFLLVFTGIFIIYTALTRIH